MTSRHDIEVQFAQAIVDAGIARPGVVIPADGRIHRFPLPDDKPGRQTGWAVLHLDGVPHGIAGEWRHGSVFHWVSEDRAATVAERKRFEAVRRRREMERAALAARAAKKGSSLWARFPRAPDDHPYLSRKQVGAGPCRVTRNGSLVVRVSDVTTGALLSLQFIRPDGEKRFMAGGRPQGGSCVLGDLEGAQPIVIAEGYATAASIHEATRWPTVVAFNRGNLRAVAEALRERFPGRDLVVAADNDEKTDGNPGLRDATAAARAVGARLAVPPVPGDFNDVHCSRGAGAVREALEHASPIPPETEPDMPPKVHEMPGFEMTPSGLYWFDRSNPEGARLKLAGPFQIEAESRDDENHAWSLLLSWHDHDGRPHSWAMPRSWLAGDGADLRRVLLDGGLYVSPGKAAREKLMAYLTGVRADRRVRVVARTGWHDRRYVLPDGAIGEGDGETVLLQTPGALDHSYRIRSSLDLWQKKVARYAAGNSRLVFGICAGLAAPILHICGAESGGFHFRGPSSTGKSTALIVAGSLWGGGGVMGYCRSWRATSNGLEGIAAMHCDALLCLDEIAQVSPRDAGEAVYMLANGTGKGRAARDGTPRRPVRWRVQFLSSGEGGLAEKLAEDGRARQLSAGQQVRIAEIPADAGAGLGLFENVYGFASAAAFARYLRRAAMAYYGTAARAFLAFVSADLKHIPGMLDLSAAEFVEANVPAGADGQVTRVAQRFGLVAATGEMAIGAGILPWKEGEALRGVARCFRDWLAERGGVEAAEIRNAVAQIRRFLELHGDSRFTLISDASEPRSTTINRAGFRRQDGRGETEWLVLPEVWRSELCAGFDPKLVAAALSKKGLLLPDVSDGKPQSRHRLPGLGIRRCYRLSAAIFGADHVAE